ncbi:hypothetical protein VKT23_013986 [Stygiomarasmius scandens]|uniref:CHAT domain-containing protein n=1 Tax=Marasmiellus scandens TaxID=2682957 RepID=A0ABR1J517_9AGAR
METMVAESRRTLSSSILNEHEGKNTGFYTDNDQSEQALELMRPAEQSMECFEQSGDMSELNNAVQLMEKAIDVLPNDHADKPSWLRFFGLALLSRFECCGELPDIEKAISLLQQAVNLTSDDHEDKLLHLSSLGSALTVLFQCFGKLQDIERAITLKQQAVDFTPDGHADKPSHLNGLGNAFCLRFEHLSELSDLEKAISALQQAVELTPDVHVHKPGMLANLGNAFCYRFECHGELLDIDKAVSMSQKAVDLTPDGHVNKPIYLNSLGIAAQTRFRRVGELQDIETAISSLQKAVDLTPNDHMDNLTWLNNLGTAVQSRFQHLGELSDIKRAIHVQQQAVYLTPDGHANKPTMFANLGATFWLQFRYLGEISDIEQAINFLQQAITLAPNSHVSKPSWFNSLGAVLQSRFEQLGGLPDLDKAIDMFQQAIDFAPNDHASRPAYLNNLAKALLFRSKHLNELQDAEKAVIIEKQALDLTPDGHANKINRLSTLGDAFFYQYQCLGHSSYRDYALSAYKDASLQPSGKPSFQLQAALSWSNLCSTPSSAMLAYKRFFELIPRVVWLGQTVGHRYKELPLVGKAINAAIATAISVGNLSQAVEWLEEGRSVVWHQILQLRSPLDELQQKHPEMARELQMISQALENAGTSPGHDLSNIGSEIKHTTAEEEAQEHHRLATQYEDSITKIRQLDGFDHFLQPKKLPELASAATHGPVIMVNMHESQCDALVLCSSGQIIHIPLPNFSLKQAENFHSKLIFSRQAHVIQINQEGDRVMHSAKNGHNDLKSILADLWNNVVEPILSDIKLEVVLCKNATDSLPHVTWCATSALTFLPLHAAGIYGSNNPQKTSDFVVSSYITTLTARLNSISKCKQNLIQTPNILIVSQPNTPGQRPLPGTIREVEVIQKHALPENTCHLTHEAATSAAVISKMSKYNFIHFACHGIQDLQNPLNSAFVLYDQKLMLKDLMKLSLENAELAILSACQTATGDETLPEEAIHLAAGMLSIGYPSVIATMWAIGDNDAPLLADKLYANLFKNYSDHSPNQNQNILSPAYALHEAVKHLQEQIGIMKFERWVPFIHFGA